jgi:hypothetical protein
MADKLHDPPLVHLPVRHDDGCRHDLTMGAGRLARARQKVEWGPWLVGLVSELFISRFIDHMSKWERKDLIDMIHLSSAAGYANYVCAEAHTGMQLRDAQRAHGRHETVFTT